MKHTWRWLLAAALLLVACERQDSARATAPQAQQDPPAQDKPAQALREAPAPGAPAHEEPASAPGSMSSSAQSPVDALNALDPRKPVPLQPMMAWHQKQNMQQHLVAIGEINEGLARQDWDAVIKAAGAIGTSPEMTQMCQHMGAGAEGFTEMALEFHQRADGIKAAAQKKDRAAVLEATAHTIKACTSCHATWRQDVVDAATWQQRTGSAHQPMMHHGHGQ